ncbi:MAG: glycosyltransferase family 39 protein [Deltaproteobacteria bacterium]|nr:glycosyltransferase family 39 protein [Deltaproteobacteria bacterium]
MITRSLTVKGLAAALVLAISLALRCYALSRSSYWNDEMLSLSYARSPEWGSVLWDNSPPVYHSLLKLWVSLFGITEIATRGLSVIFSVGATAVVMKAGHELRGPRGMLCAGALHALACLSINYAQETRMYALYEFCTAVNLLYFMRLYLDCGNRSAKLYAASVALVASTNYLAVVPLFSEKLLFLGRYLLRPKKAPKTLIAHLALAGGLAGIGASCLWWIKWDALGWQKAKFAIEASSRYPVVLVGKLFGFSWIFAIAFTCIVIASEFTAKGRRERLTLAAMVLLPMAMMTAASFVFQRGMLLERYLINVVPPFALWASVALLDSAWGTKFKWSAAVVLFAAALAALPKAYVPYKEDWREAAEIVHRNPGLVLTMSKPALRAPYFEHYGIQLEQWDPRDEDSEELLRREVLSLGRVWIVDSQTNAKLFPTIRQWVTDLGFRESSFSVETGNYSSLKLMLIEDPSP